MIDLLVMPSTPRIPLWQYLWQLIRYAPRLYLLDSFLWLLIMGLPAVPGLIIREFFDSLTSDSPSRPSPLWFAALLLGVGTARIVAIFAGRVTKTQHRFTISSLVRHNLLAKLLQKPGAEPFTIHHKTLSPGEVISFFREDVAQIEDNVVGTNEILGAGVFAIASLFILFSVNARLTLFVFLPLVAIALVVQSAETHIKHYRSASRQATQRVTGLMGELFGTVQAIQIAGAEHNVLHQFRQLSEQRRQRMVRDQVFTAALNSILENLVNLGTGLILLLAALLNATEVRSLNVGDFALFVYYLAFITDFFWFMGGFLTLTKQTEVAFERMGGVMDGETQAIVAPAPLYLPNLQAQNSNRDRVHSPSLQPSLPDEIPPLQELSALNLTYRYPGSTSGIADITLTLQRGSLTVITGQIGSGKTTLLRLLLGLLPLQSGELYWNGQPIAHPDRFFVPPRSAYVPQVPQLFSTTLRENLLLGLPQRDKDLQRAIVLAALDPDLATMPEGLNTLIGSKGMRLSGGQQQRTAAARMLIRQPELLVFDDLSSALDLETEQKLWASLFTLNQHSFPGYSSITQTPVRSAELLSDRDEVHPSPHCYNPTFLVVSHRPSLLQRADQIIVLNNGKVEAQGKPDDLQKFLPELT